MRRLQLLETSDIPWFPAAIRRFETEFLSFLFSTFRVYHPAVPLLKEAMVAVGSDQILDLCSGSGGPLPGIKQLLERKYSLRVKIVLSDKFPRREHKDLTHPLPQELDYLIEPVDALDVPAGLNAFRTLFTSFHHFDPACAKQILADASAKAPGIAVFEATERSLAAVLRELFLPLTVLLLTPFVRPFSWKRLLWTYLIPAVPVVMLWNGIVSDLRSYTRSELEALVESLEQNSFVWQTGTCRSFLSRITFLIGRKNSLSV